MSEHVSVFPGSGARGVGREVAGDPFQGHPPRPSDCARSSRGNSCASMMEWRHVLTWSHGDGEQRLMDRAAEFDAVTKLHDLLADGAGEEPMRGEIVHAAP